MEPRILSSRPARAAAAQRAPTAGLEVDQGAELAPWTAPPDGFGQFLCDVFDEWLARDVGQVFVQLIEERVATLAGLVNSARQAAFGRAKREPLPERCLGCDHLAGCWGGCPKHRFVPAARGAPESYLCPSYRRFFAHTARALAPFAAALRADAQAAARP